MLDLKKSDRNRIVIFEESVGERKGIYYTAPTTSQMVKYNRESVKKKGRKISYDAGEAYMVALRFGAEVLTWFDEFNLRENDDGTYSTIDRDYAYGYDGKPISPDPASPNYREDWKDLLKESVPNHVALVARVAFDGARTQQGGVDVDLEIEVEESPPLPKS